MIFRILIIFFITSHCAPRNKGHKPLPVDHAPAVIQNSMVDYAQVKPIFAQHCFSCHPSRSAPNWLDYAQALPYAKNGKLKQRVVEEKSMPPLSSPEAALVTDEERKLISQWIASGAPETVELRTENVSEPPQENSDHPDFVSPCLACHGKQDPLTYLSSDVPKISGQNQKYLWHQLMNFKWYDRIDPSFEMNQQTASLSDEMIVKIAEYFSQLSNAPEPNQAPRLNSEEQILFARGERIAKIACVQCHKARQEDFSKWGDLIPILNGQSRNYLRAQMLSYQKGLRENNMMEYIVRGYTHDDIEAIAIYFSHSGYQSSSPDHNLMERSNLPERSEGTNDNQVPEQNRR